MKPNTRQLLGSLNGVLTVFPAIAAAFLIVRPFWPCPQGGCALESWAARGHVIGIIVAMIALMISINVVLQFVFVLLVRPFLRREDIESLMFQIRIPGLGWYERLMKHWIRLLWGTA